MAYQECPLSIDSSLTPLLQAACPQSRIASVELGYYSPAHPIHPSPLEPTSPTAVPYQPPNTVPAARLRSPNFFFAFSIRDSIRPSLAILPGVCGRSFRCSSWVAALKTLAKGPLPAIPFKCASCIPRYINCCGVSCPWPRCTNGTCCPCGPTIPNCLASNGDSP